jgi:foldase protein PrsA
MIKGKGFTKEQLLNFLVRNQQVNAYYDKQFTGLQYDKVKVQHILISLNDEKGKNKRTEPQAKTRAEEVKKKLEAGGDFSKLAKQYSDDPESKNKGGFVEGPADLFFPEFAKVAKTLPLNKISNPVKTNYGYHIMRVVQRGKENVNEAPEQIKQIKQQEIFQRVITKELKFKFLLPSAKPATK